MADEDLSRLKIDKAKAAFQPRRKRQFLYPSLVLAALLLVVVSLLGVFAPAKQVRVTTVAQVYPSSTLVVLNASGYVVPQRKAALASKITGRLVWLGVEEGSLVKKNQVVARLEGQDAAAVQEQAAANLEQARVELRDAALAYNRHRELLAKGVIARATYDAVLARYEKAAAGVKAAEAALTGARVSLEYTLIRAPFTGVVLTKDADIGDIVTPIGAAAEAKAAVVTIADMESLQVEADVSEANLGLVKAGQPCEIQLDAVPGERFAGVIHMLVPTVDRTKATVMVKVRFLAKDNRILPQMSAKVAFLSRAIKPEENRPRLAVNQGAVVKRGEKEMVFVVQGNRVREQSISVGIRIGETVEVLEGVKAGDRVVLNPPPHLRDGSRIKVAEE
jgi:RND family efflux transporter MFP subunit